MYLRIGGVGILVLAFIAVAVLSGVVGYWQAEFICDQLASVDRVFAGIGQIVVLVIVLAIGGALLCLCVRNQWSGTRCR